MDKNDGEGVVVAVVDSGVNYYHVDIAANIWVNPGEIANNGIDDDNNGHIDDIRGWNFIHDNAFPLDGAGHGSHVAGTVAATIHNDEGVVGVAPRAKIMPLKGLPDFGFGSVTALVEALEYAVENGAQVINNSWQCVSPCPDNYVYDAVIRRAVAADIVVIFAAGNNGDDIADYRPQNMSETFTVGATNPHGGIASFSSRGEELDLVAPGTKIRSLGLGNLGYVSLQGTSMAAPHVAGVAALLLAVSPTPLTTSEVYAALRSGARDYGQSGFDTESGHGELDASGALQSLEGTPMEYEIRFEIPQDSQFWASKRFQYMQAKSE